LEEFVSGSEDEGFIIVSFGSVLRGANMSPETRRVFMSTFSRLKQRVVWKWEDEMKPSSSPDDDDLVPSNVKLVPWLPQQDLLGHPKARLFITHGGLCSNQEAVYHGVPLIAMPVFADQFINAQKAHDDGYAIRFEWDKMAQEGALYEVIQQVLNNSKYITCQ
jgi:glucuronosyltransferase